MNHQESDYISSTTHYSSNQNQSGETDELDELNNYFQIGEFDNDTGNDYLDDLKEIEKNIKLHENEEEKKEAGIYFASLFNIETNQNL